MPGKAQTARYARFEAGLWLARNISSIRHKSRVSAIFRFAIIAPNASSATASLISNRRRQRERVAHNHQQIQGAALCAVALPTHASGSRPQLEAGTRVGCMPKETGRCR
jgi:hypothetical protein